MNPNLALAARRVRRGTSELLARSALVVANGVMGVQGLAAEDSGVARSPAEWLAAMDAAFRSLDYDGVFTYYATSHSEIQLRRGIAKDSGGRAVRFSAGFSAGVELASFRIVHKVIGGVEHERIAHLDGPQREILRTGDEVVYVLHPGDELLDLHGAIPAGPYARILMGSPLDLGDSYQVVQSGQGRVAGRPSIRLDIVPRDGDRFGHRLWLDEATSLLLRSELRDLAGNHLEMVQFTSLRVGEAVMAADLEPSSAGVQVGGLADPSAKSVAEPATLRWHAGWVPQGFRMTTNDVSPPVNGSDVVSLMFSDGLAAFSVFVETMPEAGAGNVMSRSGATVVLTQSAAGESGDHLVTVVGEVPVATARRVAAGMYYKP